MGMFHTNLESLAPVNHGSVGPQEPPRQHWSDQLRQGIELHHKAIWVLGGGGGARCMDKHARGAH